MKINSIKSLTRILLAAVVSAVMCSATSNGLAQQSIATWWVNSQTNLPPPNPFTNNTANLNVIVGPMMKGFGITEPSGTAEYGGSGWTNTGVADSEASSITNGLFITYSIQAAPGYTVSFSTNVLYYHNSATGPINGELQYSTDGINYTDISPMTYAATHAAATALLTNNLSTIPSLQNVPSTTTNFFRIVNWGATGTAGTWYIYDDPPAVAGTNGFVVLGSVVPVPPAENLVTWWVNLQTNLPPPNPFTNNTADPNVAVTPMMKGFGITEPSGTAEYGGSGWTNAGVADSEASSITNGLYLTYAIQAAPGYTVSFFTNILFYHNSATGPINGELQYSTDGVNYTDIATMTYSATHAAATALLTNNLSNVQALQNVPSTTTNFFRIVNWGATGTAGTWYIYDNPPAAAGTNGFVVIGGLLSLYGVVAPTNLVVSPSSITANAGQTVSFGATANGSPASNFWYQLIGSTPTLIPNATSLTLTLSNVLGANAGNYFAVLTNSSGSATSAVVSLTVIDPIIEVQPSSVAGLEQGTVQFAVTVAGTSPVYQWYYTDINGNFIAPVGNGTQADFSVISGAASNVLTIANLQTTDLTNFVVVVTNAYGALTSSVASFLSGTNTPGTLPYTSGVLALWDFDGTQFTNTSVNPNCLNNPAPFIGYGTASAVGMPNEPGTSPFSGATDPGDVGYDPGEGYVFTPYGFEQPSPNFSWGTENYPAVTGTNKQNGVQFNVSTVGARNIRVSYDSRVSSTASDYERMQYTTNGTTWIDYPASSTFSGIYGSGNTGFYPFNYSLVGFPGVDNNPNFGIRIVTEWQSTATYQTLATSANTNNLGVNGVYATNFWVGTANSYSSGASGNSAGGTVTYDLVAFIGDAITNNNTPPTIGSFTNMPVTNNLAFTNMVDTNTLVLNFTASSPQMAASNLTFTVQSLNTVSAGAFNPTVSPTFSVANTGATNFQLNISFSPGSYIPDPQDAAPILVTATDTNGESATTWFLLTAASINQPPTNSLTSLHATNMLVNKSLVIPFTVGSARDPYSSLTYSVNSDNNTVIPTGSVVIGGSTGTGNPTVTITPAAGQVGNAVISVSVSDNDPAEPRTTTASIAVMVRPNTNIVGIDYFTYDSSSGPLDTLAAGYWQHLSGINQQLQAGSGVATIVGGNTENLQARLLGSPYKTNSGAVLYSSFTVNMNPSELPSANGSYFTAFNDGSGATADVEGCLVAATNGAAQNKYRLGIANVVGADATSAQMFPQDLTPGVNYFVVLRLALSNGYSTLWISPTNQFAASVTDTTPPASSTNLYNIVNFELRQSGTYEGTINVGSLLVGLTFASVFYPPLANPDNFGVSENSVGDMLSPLLNDAGSSLSLTSVTPDANGTASIVSGTSVLFTPVTNFLGTSIIGYTIEDDMGNITNSTITVDGYQ